MTEGIIIALVTGICAIIGQWMITRSESKKAEDKRNEDKKERTVAQAVKDAELKNQLAIIEKKLDIHNGYAEKFATVTLHLEEIDKAIVAMQKDIEYIRKGA